MDSQDQNMQLVNVSQDSQNGPNYGAQSGDDYPPSPPNNSTDVKKLSRSRGVNFSIEEDKLLISAWLNCSLDGVQGTDQKHSQLWEKIFEYFHQYKETTTKRTMKSLIHRWSNIQKATSKFCKKLAEVEGLNQSGMTEQDKFVKAKIMYQSLEKCNFQFEHCWHVLKDEPKWILHIRKDHVKRRRTVFQYPNPTPTCSFPPVDDSVMDHETMNETENEVIESDRPMGRKAKNGKRKARRQAEEIIQLKKMKYTLLEESHAQQKEFYSLKAKKIEYDKEREEKKLHFEDERLRLKAEKLRIKAEKTQSKIRHEDERLRLEAEKMELAKKESDQRIMMMDVSVMSEMQRLYFEELRREIMLRRRNT